MASQGKFLQVPLLHVFLHYYTTSFKLGLWSVKWDVSLGCRYSSTTHSEENPRSKVYLGKKKKKRNNYFVGKQVINYSEVAAVLNTTSDGKPSAKTLKPLNASHSFKEQLPCWSFVADWFQLNNSVATRSEAVPYPTSSNKSSKTNTSGTDPTTGTEASRP